MGLGKSITVTSYGTGGCSAIASAARGILPASVTAYSSMVALTDYRSGAPADKLIRRIFWAAR
jgi:hypothetical protein